MRKFALLAAVAATFAAGAVAVQAQQNDPYIWLEEVEGQRALDWVRARNAETAAILEKAPKFEEYKQRAIEILNDDRRIAHPDEVQGESVTNFWQDATNVRGLWRVASVGSYVAGKPQWRTLLDVDALAKAEGKNWVWKGATCLKPDYQRCLVALSDGGKDAVVWREFDMASAKFVDEGFPETPVAKSVVAWVDRDTLLIRSDFGPGTLTNSGYGRQVRLWKRTTPLMNAKLIAEAKVDDVWASPFVARDGDTAYPMVTRGITFWTGELSHMKADGSLVRSPLPLDADYQDMLDGRVIALLHGDWTHGAQTFKAGSLVAYPVQPLLDGKAPAVELVYAPTGTIAVEEVSAAKSALFVKVLDNVAGKLLSLTRRSDGRWTAATMPLPANSVVALEETSGKADLAFVNVEGLTQPDTLMAVTPGQAPKTVASLPAKFDASQFEVNQRFATSKDGARVPYFVVRKKGTTGPVPTLMHGYGGFRAAQNPVYLSKHPSRLGPLAQFWVEEGNAFVLANIRGGGEFGPAWHEQTLKANRQKVYDDFHAIAEDLKKNGITSKLGISGRSNGGLLVGTAYTQRPDLYQAVLMGVPLADMQRYHKLLAGASWMDEYGDPDKPEEWAYISKYSPYQNLKKDAVYPKVMFYTSTKDDRVHPAHARKMAARMAEYGHPFYYFENIDGGHAGSANRMEEAYRAALLLAYLNRELRGTNAGGEVVAK